MTAKTIGRWTGIALLAVGFLTANSSPIAQPSTASAAERSSYDPMMRSAAADRGAALARESFPRFLAGAMGRSGKTLPGSAARVRMTNSEGAVEFLWLERIGRTGEFFVGQSLADASAQHKFVLTDVVDWSHPGQDGRLHGNFGAREIAEVLPAHHAALMTAALSLHAYPSGW
ncbi:hypothetical protein GQ651_08715 [Alphaproteobacteria bacterium GH1-50]|uniref:DUF2314 domain-containing protein n=1 Tax=Kangsaoukella pontilimi TaxID=2691042 RepID=A0A7C9IGG4_9RHOB|nr:hypothetical protein [Kangsaoukella pontilimi]MXQ07927.1 hypothetical protein [Kangsaoukella pontilimi]